MYAPLIDRIGKYSILLFVAGSALVAWALIEQFANDHKLSGLPAMILFPCAIVVWWMGLGIAVCDWRYFKSRRSRIGMLLNGGVLAALALTAIRAALAG